MFEHNGKPKLREAIVSGIFYPEEPSELRERIGELLASNKAPRTGATAIVAPHAGLRYSGDLAALAWNAAAGRAIKSVIILSPVHRPSEASISLPESDYFDGPFGKVRVDRSLVEEMMDCGTLFRMNDIPHFEEHGVEVQLPFMTTLFPEASLVPVILGSATASSVKALSASLELVIRERAAESLIVISSDLSGGSLNGSARPRPAATGQTVATEAERFLDLIVTEDWKSMLVSADAELPTTCGAGCLAAYLSSSLSQGRKATLLGRHDSSACRESPEERLVHYAAIAYFEG